MTLHQSARDFVNKTQWDLICSRLNPQQRREALTTSLHYINQLLEKQDNDAE